MASTLELWLLAMLNQRPQLIQKQVLAATASTVVFSPIPQQFTNLRLVISAKSDGVSNAAGYDDVYMQFNGITSAYYNWWTWSLPVGGSMGTASGATQNAMQCAVAWNSHFTTAGRGVTALDIPNYSDSSNLKGFTGQSAATDGGAAGAMQGYSGMLSTTGGTAAITSISLAMGVGNFVADSTFCLYGN